MASQTARTVREGVLMALAAAALVTATKVRCAPTANAAEGSTTSIDQSPSTSGQASDAASAAPTNVDIPDAAFVVLRFAMNPPCCG